MSTHTLSAAELAEPTGAIVCIDGDDWYQIDHAEAMATFFMSIVSDDDHWLFVASNGALSCGRGNRDRALFPYYTVDRIIDDVHTTGPFTELRVGGQRWRPFSDEGHPRSLAKPVIGNALRSSATNPVCGLTFTSTWETSARYGFVRRCSLRNDGEQTVEVDVLDGLRNILPAHVQAVAQQQYSCLLDAYKACDLDIDSGLACYSLASQLCDLAEPRESLRATTVWADGLEGADILIDDSQIAAWSRGDEVAMPQRHRGRRGAYLLSKRVSLAPGETASWAIVADVHRSLAQCVALRRQLLADRDLGAAVSADVAAGTRRLRRLLGETDAFQRSGDHLASAHHLANVLFNDMRGGVYADGYTIERDDALAFLARRRSGLVERHQDLLAGLPPRMDRVTWIATISQSGDPDLQRLGHEYLPLWFSRRHGDPSRPWNRFDIRIRDDDGMRVLDYQGNWRDIFQNWEALSYAYPDYLPHIILTFLNATNAEGYNPYRISRDGIDWEVPDPDDPWAGIGYWGDHQVIYLLKLLELCRATRPEALRGLLGQDCCAYANVPYRLASYANIRQDPHNTIDFDRERHALIETLVERMGADGRLLLDAGGGVYHVGLVEKLLVMVLGKLANFVPDGGIWMNTQRPEWNDANNALVGWGLSMVTLCYLRRCLVFLDGLFAELPERVTLSAEVADWLAAVRGIIEAHGSALTAGGLAAGARGAIVDALGEAADRYRSLVYAQGFSGRRAVDGAEIRRLVTVCLPVLDACIRGNRRDDGLLHAYNLMQRQADGGITIGHLDVMLEGQVAALSAGCFDADDCAAMLQALRASPLYRADQHSYILYPDRELPAFFDKNQLPEGGVVAIPSLRAMLAAGDERVIERDVDGGIHFHADCINAERLRQRLAACGVPSDEHAAIEALYESVFQHHRFTGRSGSMFAYEGLGSIYWHMVSKLMLACQENVFAAIEAGADLERQIDLAASYYDLRAGIGFNKSPSRYGAFPLDPYSHTPGHAGAQQPGMTGQVKEEVITRMAEVGLRYRDGRLTFDGTLVRGSEFLTHPDAMACVGADGQERLIELAADSYAVTCCGVPVVVSRGPAPLRIRCHDGSVVTQAGAALDATWSASLFAREGRIERIEVGLEPGLPEW